MICSYERRVNWNRYFLEKEVYNPWLTHPVKIELDKYDSSISWNQKRFYISNNPKPFYDLIYDEKKTEILELRGGHKYFD